jgi:hypothetical protein
MIYLTGNLRIISDSSVSEILIFLTIISGCSGKMSTVIKIPFSIGMVLYS